MSRLRLLYVLLITASCSQAARTTSELAPSEPQARRELERLYQANASAYERGDLQALMALRAPDFHSVTPDGLVHDRTELTRYIEGFINGVRKWNQQSITIDSLTVAGDTAYAVISQYLDRMALRSDNQVHRVQTWVTQRESWVRAGRRWLLWRVDQLRNQRRLVDGKPG
jgi:ketosteroid isomerase-like protein